MELEIGDDPRVSSRRLEAQSFDSFRRLGVLDLGRDRAHEFEWSVPTIESRRA